MTCRTRMVKELRTKGLGENERDAEDVPWLWKRVTQKGTRYMPGIQMNDPLRRWRIKYRDCSIDEGLTGGVENPWQLAFWESTETIDTRWHSPAVSQCRSLETRGAP